jgi:hypothetical protein
MGPLHPTELAAALEHGASVIIQARLVRIRCEATPALP